MLNRCSQRYSTLNLDTLIYEIWWKKLLLGKRDENVLITVSFYTKLPNNKKINWNNILETREGHSVIVFAINERTFQPNHKENASYYDKEVHFAW